MATDTGRRNVSLSVCSMRPRTNDGDWLVPVVSLTSLRNALTLLSNALNRRLSSVLNLLLGRVRVGLEAPSARTPRDAVRVRWATCPHRCRAGG